MTKKGRKKRKKYVFCVLFLSMFMNVNKNSYLQTKILTKLTKKSKILVCSK